jgi:hypothetical protein
MAQSTTIEAGDLSSLHQQISAAADVAGEAGRFAGVPDDGTGTGVEVMSGGPEGPGITRRTDLATGDATLSVRLQDGGTRTHVEIGGDGSATTTIHRPEEGAEGTTRSARPALAHGLALAATQDVVTAPPKSENR